MNIFLIPSWYPDEKNYVQGIFIKEQIEAMAEFNPASEFVVSNLSAYNLPLKNSADSFKNLIKFSQSRNFKDNKLRNNLTEISNSVLTWSVKFGGNISNQIRLHENNFLNTKNRLGKIDLIHAHVSFPAGYAAMKLSQKYKIPYIITEHMGPFPFKHFINKGKLTPRVSEPLINSDKIIAVSTSLASSIESFIHKRVEVIPNLVNETVFKPADRKSVNEKIIFLSVTSLIESKGISELLDAARSSLRVNKGIEFRIIGNGSMENEVREFIGRNGLSENIILIRNPGREKITEEFRDCDIYILPSRHESFGVSYIEAMACGKPVIATDCGGPTDFINEENGVLVPVGNVEEITKAVLKLAGGIHLYNAKKIRDFFLKNFSRSVVCSRIFKAYESVIQPG